MLENVNLEKIKNIAGIVLIAGVCAVGGCTYGKLTSKTENSTKIVTDADDTLNNDKTNTVSDGNINNEESVKEEVKEEVEEVVYTELNVEDFNKLVDEVEASNKEAGLNFRRENLELAVYINNINIATPELVEKIESAYNYNEEDMINTYLNVMTSYNSDRLEYFNGEDSKYADDSVMFLDKIDRDTIQYVDELFEGLYDNMNNVEVDITMPKFNMMVKDIMDKNSELGIEVEKEALEIAIYQRNSSHVTDDVKEYINSIKLGNGLTLESIDNDVLNIYKRYNENAKQKFNLSNLYYESYYVGMVVDELEGYMRENNTINGYTKDQLTVGGLFALKMKIDDAFAYFAPTGYANEYESRIEGIAEANLDHVVSTTYAALGSKASIVECDESKALYK